MSLCSDFSANVNSNEDTEDGADDGDGDGDYEGLGTAVIIDLVTGSVGGEEEISALIVSI